VNKNSIDNPKIDLLDKIVTLEGNNDLSYKEPVKSLSLIVALRNACLAIENKLNSIFTKPSTITSITLLFKVDFLGRLNLLLCTYLRLSNSIEGTQPKRVFDNISRYVKYELVVPSEEFIKTDKMNTRDFKCIRCPICLKEINSKQLYEITNKILIELDEKREDLYLSNESKAERVPKSIKNLYPGITHRAYLNRKEDPVWQYEVSRVCTTCWQRVLKLNCRTTLQSMNTLFEQRNNVVRKPIKGMYSFEPQVYFTNDKSFKESKAEHRYEELFNLKHNKLPVDELIPKERSSKQRSSEVVRRGTPLTKRVKPNMCFTAKSKRVRSTPKMPQRYTRRTSIRVVVGTANRTCVESVRTQNTFKYSDKLIAMIKNRNNGVQSSMWELNYS